MKIVKEAIEKHNKLNQKMIPGDCLIESKADNQKLIDYAGEKLAKDFFSLKPRLKAPMNDLYYWLKRPVEELQELVDKMGTTQTRKEKEDTARSGAELIAEDDNYKVYHITTFEAAKKYGAHTQWSITGRESGWISPVEEENVYWKQYTEAGIQFYFFISKKDGHKYGVAYGPEANTTYLIPGRKADKKEIFDEKERGLQYIPNISEDLVKKLPFELGTTTSIFVIDDGFILTGIADKTYKGSVTIPNNIKNISDRALKDCENITSVVIPDSVTSIGDFAFEDCIGLKNIIIPNSVTSIGDYAFWGCRRLTKITISNNVTSINDGAFSYCSSLTSIIIPSNVKSIGEWAFNECSSLTNVIIPNSIKSIDDSAFENCSKDLVFKCDKNVDKDIIDELKKYGRVEFTESLTEDFSSPLLDFKNRINKQYPDIKVEITNSIYDGHNPKHKGMTTEILHVDNVSKNDAPHINRLLTRLINKYKDSFIFSKTDPAPYKKYYNYSLTFLAFSNDLNEAIEKHDKLNQKIFDGDKLRPEVKDKLLEIVDHFKKNLEEDDIKLDIKDVILVGSSASYNYTKDSDLDCHIVADLSVYPNQEELANKVYNAYKALWNNKFDPVIYGIPVEIFVESYRDMKEVKDEK